LILLLRREYDNCEEMFLYFSGVAVYPSVLTGWNLCLATEKNTFVPYLQKHIP